MTTEEMAAKITALEQELTESKASVVKLTAKNEEVLKEKKARPRAGDLESVMELLADEKTRRLEAEKQFADYKKTADEKLAGFDDLSQQYGHASQKLAKIELRDVVSSAAKGRIHPDLLDVAVDKLSPFLHKGDGDSYAPMKKDGGKLTPMLNDKGKPLGVGDLIADMAPGADHKLTGIDMPSLFKPLDGSEPDVAGGGGGVMVDNDVSVDDLVAQILEP